MHKPGELLSRLIRLLGLTIWLSNFTPLYGGGWRLAVPLNSTRVPVGLIPVPPLLTTKSSVLTPAMKPVLSVNALPSAVKLPSLMAPVGVPLSRTWVPLSSEVQWPLMTAVDGYRPVRLKLIRYL